MVNIKKEKALEELQDEFNTLTRKRYQLILDVDKVTKELVDLAEKIYETSPDYVKVVCLNCSGKGMLEAEEGKKVKCNVCRGKLYIFARKFIENIDEQK